MDITSHHPSPSAVAAATISTLLLLAYRDYQLYLSYGQGGLPQNAKGWAISNVLRVFMLNPYRPPKVIRPAQNNSHSTFLARALPERPGSRPYVGPHPVPQRQLDQLGQPLVKARLEAEFNKLGSLLAERDVLEVKTSSFEGHLSAIFVSSTRPWNNSAQETDGEISHIHRDIDGSVHVMLSAADSQEVIEKRWGQRHGLSGSLAFTGKRGRRLIPTTFTLLYAPRNDGEVAIVMEIVKAAVRFMTGYEGQME